MLEKVYIIDDDAIHLELTRGLVTSVGLTPVCFQDATRFLEEYSPSPCECVVSDIRMPRMSGLQLQISLNERFSVPPPLILVTGYAEVSAAVDAMKQGALDFVEKPINGQQFIDKVQHALEVSHGLHEQRLADSTRDARLALLSPKERAILDEVIKGLSSKEIAQQQGLSARTVENHRARIMEKLRAKSVVDLVREFK